MLPPSILVELMRNPHSESRKRHIAAIVGIRGRRLASEAQLCAEEFVRMVKSRRPAWMRSIADMATVAKFNKFWTRDWWKWAAEAVTGEQFHRARLSTFDERHHGVLVTHGPDPHLSQVLPLASVQRTVAVTLVLVVIVLVSPLGPPRIAM